MPGVETTIETEIDRIGAVFDRGESTLPIASR
jgi:hypothetical protein